MKRRNLLKSIGLSASTMLFGGCSLGKNKLNREQREKMVSGPFSPQWSSLENYIVPEWFCDAKFGIWAHWGPQCEPEAGDWYGRGMYQEGSEQYQFHLKKYGHPSKFGFKDVINEWKADKWDAEHLVDLYKKAGAKYFVAMANHHDNFDLFDSDYQPDWNSTQMGPKRNIIEEWAAAAKSQDLPFGVSVHASHTWSWFETAQHADLTGPYKGVPYDGHLRQIDGKGTWWEGLDPQALYAQNHPLSDDSFDKDVLDKQWDWAGGVYPPSPEYIDKFFNRTMDLVTKYSPDLLYFDDSQLPFWPIDRSGLDIAANIYNKNLSENGVVNTVITGKKLTDQQRSSMVWDIERGKSNQIEPLPWQTCTCIGNWHYKRDIYDNNEYKSAQTVIHTLIDVVSKNGNLLLSIPIRGDGSLDELELAILEDISDWMSKNSDCIYATRPWKIYGEGPAQESDAALTEQRFNEGKGKPFSAQDIRFTTKGDVLYAIVMGWPKTDEVNITSLAKGNPYIQNNITTVLWGENNELVQAKQTSEGLLVKVPREKQHNDYACVFKISLS